MTWAPVWTKSGPTDPAAVWVSLVSFLGAFLIPPASSKESYFKAVRRIFAEVFKDPFFYIAVAFLALLVVPLFNVGLCPYCDSRAIANGADPLPPYRFLPFCVNPVEHASVIRWFLTSLVAAFAFRHGLVRRWRRAGFEVLVWNAAVLSCFGFIKMAAGVRGPANSFAVFGYPNHGGAFFLLMFTMAMGLWCYRMMRFSDPNVDTDTIRHPLLVRHYPAIAAALCFFALVATMCRAAMLFSTLVVIVFFVYVFLASIAGKRRTHRIKGLSAVLILVGFVLSVVIYAPPEVGRELASLSTRDVADRAAGRGQYHERVAGAMMRDYPFFGVGGWGYRHLCLSYMGDKELGSVQRDGGANVHNDYMQFVVEHGLVGFFLLVLCFFRLVRTIGRGWLVEYSHYRFSPTAKTPVSPQAIYAVEPTVLFTMLGCVFILMHALGDCPLRSPAVMVSLFASLAAVTGYFEH